MRPKLVDNRLLKVYEPKSISTTITSLSSLSVNPVKRLSNIKIDTRKVSRNTKYALSNFLAIFIILIAFIVLYSWHIKLSHSRFIYQNIHLTGPNAYEPIKPYDFMTKNFHG